MRELFVTRAPDASRTHACVSPRDSPHLARAAQRVPDAAARRPRRGGRLPRRVPGLDPDHEHAAGHAGAVARGGRRRRRGAVRSARVHRLLPGRAGRAPADQQLDGVADVDGDPRRHAVGQAAAPDPPAATPSPPSTSRRSRCGSSSCRRSSCCCSRRRGTAWRSTIRRCCRILAASLVGAWLLTFFSMVLLGSLAFYVDSAMGVFELWIGVHAILSGYLIPLEVLPRWVRAAADVLPFRFMLAFPGRDPGRAADARRAALRQLGGAVGLRRRDGASRRAAAWRAGVRRFAAFGG